MHHPDHYVTLRYSGGTNLCRPWISQPTAGSGAGLIVEGVLSDHSCDRLLRHFRSSADRPRSYQGVVDESQRKCTFVVVPDMLAHLATDVVTPYVEEYVGVDTQPLARQPQLIYRYDQGVGFVTHHDEVTMIELERARLNGQPVISGNLTTILFLNHPQEYGGGALYFEDPPLEVRPPRGTLVAFPASRDFMHGVRQVEYGERYTLL